MHIFRSRFVSVLALSLFFSLPSIAESPPGRLLASQCAQCHGTNGQAVSNLRSLAGIKADVLYKKLLSLKNSKPPFDIMDLQAKGYTDNQLWLIAQYYSTLPSK